MYASSHVIRITRAARIRIIRYMISSAHVYGLSKVFTMAMHMVIRIIKISSLHV